MLSNPRSKSDYFIDLNSRLKHSYTLEKLYHRLLKLECIQIPITIGQIDDALFHISIERALDFPRVVCRSVPSDLLDRVANLTMGVEDPELALIILRSDYPDWKIVVVDGVVQVLPP